jgi:oligo-alginate lyase
MIALAAFALVAPAEASLFDQEVARARAGVEASIRAGVIVPPPQGQGGSPAHEQHKRNYRAIYEAGHLLRITADRRYLEHGRALLLAYARLFPTLGPHPAKANQTPGRLFWQSLNDSVFLVHAAQGYAELKPGLSAADRATIEAGLLRPMARFLSDETPESFDRIHNHATWAAAGVGLTGYAIGDRALVEKALMGRDGSGKTGFLRQLDLLFSPDGYYAEGPYYQRYALQPFVVFASAVDANEPARKIFQYRDGIVLKAVTTAIALTYDGYFLPINDAMPDKSLRTEELYQGVAIAYAATRDPRLLSVAEWQGRTVLTPAGRALSTDLAAGKARPFVYPSRLFSDGPAGDLGALAVIRRDGSRDGPLLVAKNTQQGMGHGHFDRLNWLFYDNGQPIVTDYGAARFHNIAAKDGGRYLDENDSWAQQSIAHNVIVVDEASHFNAKWQAGEKVAPRQLAFEGAGRTRYSIAEQAGAYRDVTMRRALLMLDVEGLSGPLVLDVVRARGDRPHRYDLPTHFSGHIIDTSAKLAHNGAARPVLGKANGYQHVWVDATGSIDPAAGARLTWFTGGRFYSFRMAPSAPATMIVAESGANDPRFNLRREPMVIQRVDGQASATFVSLLEPHGAYDPSAETVVGSTSQVERLEQARVGDAQVVTIRLTGGRTITLVIADDTAKDRRHSLAIGGRQLAWTGPVGRFDTGAAR